ncbi:hypothetical protein [Psychrobacter halodurans]|uniref:Lipoprotein n=1 Tax=Psychrobacter halodurans TaxID=2818439 RepID=A0AAW4IQ24_9GAMM|nr:hypothetical protein [Psychrobacter halodurans]MBO1517563.1 hypothetical protein [Psychrobacter halodurans]
MKKPQQTHTSRLPLASTINGHAVFASALVAGAALLTGCQSTSLGQSNAMTTNQTSASAKTAVASALQAQRRQSFRYHSNLEISNKQQFDGITAQSTTNNGAKNPVTTDDIYQYCEDTHDEAYAALLAQAKGQKQDISATKYDAQRATIKQSYLACTDAYQAWQDSQYDSEVRVPADYQKLFDNYDAQPTAQGMKKAKLLDAYLLKPLSINAQGVYQPMAGKATMLASVQYQARNHQSSLNQPVYIDFKNGDIYLWADNFAMINSKLLDDKLGTIWQNKWLKITLDDGTLPKGFGKAVITHHFAALDAAFAAAPASQFEYVAPTSLTTLSPKLPAHQLPAMLASEQVIRRTQSVASHEQSYQDYMRDFYERISQQYPELVNDSANGADSASDIAPDVFTSKALVQQVLTIIKSSIDAADDDTVASRAVDTGSETTNVQTLYGVDKRGRLIWQHLRREFPSENNKYKGVVMDVMQRYSAIRPKDTAFPNLPSDVQVPNSRNSVDAREYGRELMQYYRDGNGTAIGKMIFKALPLAQERLGGID